MADSSNVIYQSVKLSVTNAAPGQKISVQLISDGVPVAFSTGKPIASQAGIALSSQSGTVPLQQLTLNAKNLTLQTSSSSGGGGGGAMVFQIGTWLAAEPDVTTFSLQSSSDPGVQVMATIGHSQAQAVNATPTTFNWNPV